MTRPSGRVKSLSKVFKYRGSARVTLTQSDWYGIRRRDLTREKAVVFLGVGNELSDRPRKANVGTSLS